MNIYVGNLPYQAEESTLESLFAEYGEVASVKIIRDFDTGRSKGFGFVTMPSDDQANEAIQAIDGTDFQGRALKVNEARPREEGGGGGFRGGRGGGGGGGGGGFRGGRGGGGGGGGPRGGGRDRGDRRY